MGTLTTKLGLSQYDGGDSPRWTEDLNPPLGEVSTSYNQDMAKIDAWAALIETDIATIEANIATIEANITIIETDITTIEANLLSHTHDGTDAAQVSHTDLLDISTTGVGALHVTGGDAHAHTAGEGAQIDHGELGGLADDDHPQYLLHSLAGTETSPFLLGNGDNAFIIKTPLQVREILGIKDVTHYLKDMQYSVLNGNYEVTGSPGEWLWIDDSQKGLTKLTFSNIIAGDRLDVRAMGRAIATPPNEVDLSLAIAIVNGVGNPTNDNGAGKPTVLSMMTSAYGVQSGAVSSEYVFGSSYSTITIWLGVKNNLVQNYALRAVSTSPYSTSERYTRLSASLYREVG